MWTSTKKNRSHTKGVGAQWANVQDVYFGSSLKQFSLVFVTLKNLNMPNHTKT